MLDNPTRKPFGRPEDEFIGVGRSVAFGFQHVLTMYGGIIAPPLIVGGAAGLSGSQLAILITSCLFVGGLATILQSVGIPFFGSQLPLVQGTSFAGVATMTSIVTNGHGIATVFGAVLVSALLGFAIAPLFSRIVRFFPPVVTGVVITTIGLSLIPTAADWALGNDDKAPDYGSVKNIALAGFTLLLVIVLSKIGVGIISRLSILLAIVIGTVVAWMFGMASFSDVTTGKIFALPTPFAFGAPHFHPAAIASMIIVVLVIMTETTADLLAVGEIVDTKVDQPRIANGLRADMAVSVLSPIFNGFTQSAFAQNVGLVAITKVKSRFMVAVGGLILIALGLLPAVGRVIADIPYPVLGGAGLVLFGTVTGSGVRTLAKVDFSENLNLVIVAVSIGMGVLPIASPHFWDKFPNWVQIIFDSGISSAALFAVALNLVFNHIGGNPSTGASVFAAGQERSLRYADLTALGQLQEGDRVEAGKVVDRDGKDVPVVDTEGTVVDCKVVDDDSEPV